MIHQLLSSNLFLFVDVVVLEAKKIKGHISLLKEQLAQLGTLLVALHISIDNNIIVANYIHIMFISSSPSADPKQQIREPKGTHNGPKDTHFLIIHTSTGTSFVHLVKSHLIFYPIVEFI